MCASHGGRAPQVKRKAAERVTESQAREYAAKYVAAAGAVADPVRALLELASEVLGFKDFLAGLVAGMGPDGWRYGGGEGGEQLRSELVLYERAMDRAVKVLGLINQLGLQERQITLAEQQGALIADAFFRVLDALDLSVEQQARAVEVMPRELRAIEGGTG